MLYRGFVQRMATRLTWTSGGATLGAGLVSRRWEQERRAGPAGCSGWVAGAQRLARAERSGWVAASGGGGRASGRRRGSACGPGQPAGAAARPSGGRARSGGTPSGGGQGGRLTAASAAGREGEEAVGHRPSRPACSASANDSLPRCCRRTTSRTSPACAARGSSSPPAPTAARRRHVRSIARPPSGERFRSPRASGDRAGSAPAPSAPRRGWSPSPAGGEPCSLTRCASPTVQPVKRVVPSTRTPSPPPTWTASTPRRWRRRSGASWASAVCMPR